ESYTCSHVERTSWLARPGAPRGRARLGGGCGVLVARPVPGRLPRLPGVATPPDGAGVGGHPAPGGPAGSDAWRLAGRAARAGAGAAPRDPGGRARVPDQGG